MQFNMGAARKHWDDLVAAVERGEEVVLARNGKPVAKIVRDETPDEDQGGGLEVMEDGDLCQSTQSPKRIAPLE